MLLTSGRMHQFNGIWPILIEGYENNQISSVNLMYICNLCTCILQNNYSIVRLNLKVKKSSVTKTSNETKLLLNRTTHDVVTRLENLPTVNIYYNENPFLRE